MSEATEQILTAARERIAVLDTELTGLDIQIQKIETEDKAPRIEERKQLETVISTFEGKKKSNRGRPKKDNLVLLRTEEVKNLLTKVGPMTTEELAERLATRTGSLLKTLESDDFYKVDEDGNGTIRWALANG